MALRFLHIILAISLYTGSIGVIISQHYCKEELKGSRLFIKAKDCHPVPDHTRVALHGCCKNKTADYPENLCRKNCCQNKTHYHHLDEDFLKEYFVFQEVNPDLVSPAVLNFINFRESEVSRQLVSYKPPPIRFDRQIRHQVFLC